MLYEIAPTSSSKRQLICVSLFTPTDEAPWDKTYPRPVKASGLAAARR
jgi:hypothetical protein